MDRHPRISKICKNGPTNRRVQVRRGVRLYAGPAAFCPGQVARVSFVGYLPVTAGSFGLSV